jgi:hypothetical protein
MCNALIVSSDMLIVMLQSVLIGLLSKVRSRGVGRAA